MAELDLGLVVGKPGTPGKDGLAPQENLLDNSNFSINQRGESNYTVNGYTIDRWRTMATDTLTVGMEDANMDKEFRCVITDSNGESKTTNAVCMVENTNADSTAFRILKQPANYYGALGDTATFRVVAQGIGLTYQWQYKNKSGGNWTNSSGDIAKTDTLTVGMESHRLVYIYRCLITDSNGDQMITNNVYMIEGTASFGISVQPDDYYGKMGDMAVFTVEATGEWLTYQWQYKAKDADESAWAAALGVTVTEEGITTTGTLYQFLDIDQDEVYTAAVCKMDGSIVCASGQPRKHIYNAPVSVEASTNGLVAFVLSAGSYKWVALYKGAYTKDTLPVYISKGYAAELTECMRYYQTLNVLAGTEAYASRRQMINFPAMRIAPTVTVALLGGDAFDNITADNHSLDVTGAGTYSHALVQLSADL